MNLLGSNEGKRRLLCIELPAIERYNEGRDPAYRIRVHRRHAALVLRYCLKPAHNVYELETLLPYNYPLVPPETRVTTPLQICPHVFRNQVLCLWRQGSTRESSRWDAAKFTAVFAVLAAWRWLACYEVFHETGEWPLPEAP